METRDGHGKVIYYCFDSNPVYSTRHKDVIIVPPYSCIVYPETKEFELTYVVPYSINILKTPKCGSIDNNDHFDRICHKFDSAVQALYHTFGDQ